MPSTRPGNLWCGAHAPEKAPLGVVAIQLLPEYAPIEEPLVDNPAKVRILRTSVRVSVPVITLFSSMHRSSTHSVKEIMVHELGHSFFSDLSTDFESLPFWQMFPPGTVHTQNDQFEGYRATPDETDKKEQKTRDAQAKEQAAEARKNETIIDEVGRSQPQPKAKPNTPAQPPPARPPEDVDINKAVEEFKDLVGITRPRPLTERPPTEYGYRNPGEDVAESVMFYLLKKQELETNFPARFKLVDDKYWQKRRTAKALRGPSTPEPAKP
jgi:hypothetical protein